MKKIFLGLILGWAALSFAQQYPNNGWEDDGYDQYNGRGNQNYFPDDYYYDYPQDYYPAAYYQSYYNDYRNSIVNVNWNAFFAQNRLNRWQIDQILYLNNLYSNFSAWNNFYRYNPDRWYYDRFYAMERILGPRVFVIFQNNYYHGASPIVYFQNYRRTHYLPRYRVMPHYRNVNINNYRVDRSRFRHRDNPSLRVVSNRNYSGFRNTDNRSHGNNGFRNQGNIRNSDHRGGRNNTGGFRNNTNRERPRHEGDNRSNNQGFRRENTQQQSREHNNGFRNGGNSGFRQQRNESSSPKSQHNNGNHNKGSGFRSNLANN